MDIDLNGNVAAHLPKSAAATPDALAVATARRNRPVRAPIFDELTLRELNERSDRCAHVLHALGVREGERTVLMVPPGTDFFALTFALFKLKAVPVLVDPGMGVAKLGECLARAEPTTFIGVTKAHVARLVLRWARPTLQRFVHVGSRRRIFGHNLERLLDRAPQSAWEIPATVADDRAAILFTSGSTGTPKGAVYTHGMFNAQVELIRRVWGIEHGERDLSTFPLFALFGPALGMASIVPDMDASKPASCDPAKLVDAIKRYECTNMFASPAIVDRIGRHLENSAGDAGGPSTGRAEGVGQPVLAGLRRVVSAGAPATPEALARLAQHLAPGVLIHTPYGATESLPVADIGHVEALKVRDQAPPSLRGVCVGRPVPGMRVELIEIHDQPISRWTDDLAIPANTLGEIAVHGPVVSQSYFGQERADTLAKIAAGSRRWHRMGDIGWRDDAGRIWMCGRKSHSVVTKKGRRLPSIPVEAVFEAHPAVRRAALVGVPSLQGEMGPRPVICVELEPHLAASVTPADLRKELQALGAAHEHTAEIDVFLVHPRFPMDVRHNAKIFREALAQWATKQTKS